MVAVAGASSGGAVPALEAFVGMDDTSRFRSTRRSDFVSHKDMRTRATSFGTMSAYSSTAGTPELKTEASWTGGLRSAPPSPQPCDLPPSACERPFGIAARLACETAARIGFSGSYRCTLPVGNKDQGSSSQSTSSSPSSSVVLAVGEADPDLDPVGEGFLGAAHEATPPVPQYPVRRLPSSAPTSKRPASVLKPLRRCPACPGRRRSSQGLTATSEVQAPSYFPAAAVTVATWPSSKGSLPVLAFYSALSTGASGAKHSGSAAIRRAGEWIGKVSARVTTEFTPPRRVPPSPARSLLLFVATMLLLLSVAMSAWLLIGAFAFDLEKEESLAGKQTRTGLGWSVFERSASPIRRGVIYPAFISVLGGGFLAMRHALRDALLCCL